MTALSAGAWAILAMGAMLAGFGKTAIGGLGTVAVALFAIVLPARDSTGTLLVLLLCGDLIATWTYRRTVDWRLIGRLVLPVLIGLGLGAVFLRFADDVLLRRTIGVILLVLLAVQWLSPRRESQNKAVAVSFGALAGFTTMVANAGGPAFSLYLLRSGFDKLRFLGTSAWFFFAVNLTKLPITVSLGVVRTETVLRSLALVPALLAGAFIGRWAIRFINQKLFNRLVTIFIVVAAIYLVIR